MLALALLLPVPGDPTIPGTLLSVEAQWNAILAGPKVVASLAQNDNEKTGSGVVIGQREEESSDGKPRKVGYLLTAAHVAVFDGVSIEFTTRERYPETVWHADRPEVVQRWKEQDIALIRFTIGNQDKIPSLELAGSGRNERPKTFPFNVWTIGVGHGEALILRIDRIRDKRYLRRNGLAATFFWETDLPPEQGRSGGPMLDNRGRVIGICNARSTDLGRGYYIYLDEILAPLKKEGFSWLLANK